MVTPQIVDYIKNTLNQGYAEERVKDALIKKGWGQKDVEEAIRIAKGIPAQSAPTIPIPGVGVIKPAQPAQQPVQSQPVSQPAPVQSTPTVIAQSPPPRSPLSMPAQEPIVQNTTTGSPQMPVKGTIPAITPPITTEPVLARPAPMRPVAPGTGPGPIPTRPAAQSTPSYPTGAMTTNEPITVVPRKPQEGETMSGIRPAPVVPVEAPKVKKSRGTIWYVLGGFIVLFGVYVFFGSRYGIYAFGINLFPFEELSQKIGLAPKPSELPTTQPSVEPTPVTTPAPTPAPTPEKPKVNGRTIEVYGLDGDAGSIASMALHPDGKTFAYTTLTNERNLTVFNRDTNTKEDLLQTVFTMLPVGAVPQVVSWNPVDPKTLLVQVKDTPQLMSLYLLNLTAGTGQMIVQFGTVGEGVAMSDPPPMPKWNKGGTIVLALAGDGLWKVSKDGTVKTRITPSLPIGSFDWSDNESYIAYTIRKGTEEQIWVMDSDGRNFRQLTTGGANQMAGFSPGSGSITYVAMNESNGQSTMFSINTDGSNVKQLANIDGAIREFAWSPDGSRILFLGRSKEGKQSLWMVRGDGSNLEEVIPDGEFQPMGFVSWNKEGTALYAAGFQHFLIGISF